MAKPKRRKPKPTPPQQWKKGSDALDRPLEYLDADGLSEVMEHGEGGTKRVGAYPVTLLGPEEYDSTEIEWTRVGWALVDLEARAWVRQEPWAIRVEKGRANLIRRRNRTTEFRANNPDAMPQAVEVEEAVGPDVPLRRRAELQRVLDQHAPGLRLEDLREYRTPPGRPHAHQPSEWERDRNRMEALRIVLAGQLRSSSEEPTQAAKSLLLGRAANLLLELERKWEGARKCRRRSCPGKVPPGSRSAYCSPRCRDAAKGSP
jgi:hypothetical protein